MNNPDRLNFKLQVLLNRTLREVPCERAIVALAGQGCTYGLNPGSIFTTAELSLGLLQRALDWGEAGVLDDACHDETLGDRTSVLLSALRAVLFVPIRDHQGRQVGMVYADNRILAGAFDEGKVSRVQEIVEESLQGLELELDDAGELDWAAFRTTHWN